MADLEDIYNDTKAWMYFVGEDEGSGISVYCRCPECGRYLKRGKLYTNKLGTLRFKGFKCKIHGDVEPYYDLS